MAADSAAESTVRPDDVARFAAIAAEWWDPDGPFRPLHRLNPARVAFVRAHASRRFGRNARRPRPLTGIRVLDIGCGGGLMSEALTALGAAVTGIDADPATIEIARAHARQAGLGIDYRAVAPENFAADADETFELVLNLEVVEHVADLDAFIAACARRVAPGGAMAFSTVNRTLKSLALAKVGAEYILRWLPPGTHDWRRFVKPSELAAATRRHGVRITHLEGLGYVPLADTWRPTTDLSVNYMAFAVKD